MLCVMGVCFSALVPRNRFACALSWSELGTDVPFSIGFIGLVPFELWVTAYWGCSHCRQLVTISQKEGSIVVLHLPKGHPRERQDTAILLQIQVGVEGLSTPSLNQM